MFTVRFARGKHPNLSKSRSLALTSLHFVSVIPSSTDLRVHRVCTTVEELYHALESNVLGNSSTLFIWDGAQDRFKLRGLPTSDIYGVLTVEGFDERTLSRYSDNKIIPGTSSSCRVEAHSFTSRLLNVGTLIRRLQAFILVLRSS